MTRPMSQRPPAELIHYRMAASSLGGVLLATSARGVCALALGDDESKLLAALQRDFPAARLQRAGAGTLDASDAPDPILAAIVAWIETPASAHQLPPLALDLRGSAFQLRVWQALQQIPPGSTISYGELARRLDAPRAARAVGAACAANRIALLVPCHRAVHASGELASYRWGVERKRELLRRERDGAT